MVLAGQRFGEKNITVLACSSSLDRTVGQQLFGTSCTCAAVQNVNAPIDENDLHYQTGYTISITL